MFECQAKDKNGIPRAWGRDTTPEKAETQCRWAAMQKVAQGTRWKIEDFTFEAVV